MNTNILITGAAGYIGGSVLTDLIASNNPSITKDNVFAAVRSQEQADALSQIGIKVLQLNLSDEKAVTESLLGHKISVVIQTTSSIDPSLSLPLITALSKQKEVSGRQTHYIHTSGMATVFPSTGWPEDVNKDTDPIFETEKRLAESFVMRKTDVAVIEHAKALGVRSYILVPAVVYGKGTGLWNQLSVVFPVHIASDIASKSVYKFPQNTKVGVVHISDLTALYGLLVTSILHEEKIPHGEEGYYFAIAHSMVWWESLERLATALKTRGLIDQIQLQTWPNDEFAAKTLGVPVPFVQALWNSGENMVATRPSSIGWKPKWNKDRFLDNIDDEIDAVLELGEAKSSFISSLFKAVGA